MRMRDHAMMLEHEYEQLSVSFRWFPHSTILPGVPGPMSRPPRLSIQIPAFTLIRATFNTPHRMIYPFLPVFARSLGIDLGAMSLALTARNLIGTLNPFVASLADRRGRKFGMLLAASFFVGGATLVTFWPSFPTLVAAMILLALGKYAFDPAMQAYLSDGIPYERRGAALAMTEVSWSLAFIAGVPLMGFLIARKGCELFENALSCIVQYRLIL